MAFSVFSAKIIELFIPMILNSILDINFKTPARIIIIILAGVLYFQSKYR